jgi:hypothetical protein
MAAFKGNIYQKHQKQASELSYHTHQNIYKFLNSKIDHFSANFEAEFKKESGTNGVLFDEKTEGPKSCDTVPLRPFRR